MAEGEKSGNADGWWGNWLNAAKEKTEKVFEMVSNDMAEFTATMQSDTKKAVDQAKDTMKTEGTDGTSAQDKIKKGFTSLMEGLTKVLTVEPEDTSPPKSSTSQHTGGFVDRATARLRAIQVDTGTYLNEPSGAPEKYADWLKSFEIDTVKGDISEMLVTKVEVRSLYTNLVPSQVSHADFWGRYFYKVHQLQLDEARKQALMRRAETTQKTEDSISWDDDDWSVEENTETSRTDFDTSTISSSPPPVTEEGQTADSLAAESRLQAESSEEKKSATESNISKDQSVADNDTTETQSVSTELNKDTCDSEASDVVKLSSDSLVCDSVSVKTTEPQGENSVGGEDKAQGEDSVGGEDKAQGEDSVGGEDKAQGDDTPIQESSRTPVSDQPVDLVADCSSCVIVAEDQSDEIGSVTKEPVEIKTKVKGDLVMVGSERTSPSSESSGNKELSSVDDDWEQDFDVELTEEDIKAAEEMAKKLNVTDMDYTKLTEEEDWESWD